MLHIPKNFPCAVLVVITRLIPICLCHDAPSGLVHHSYSPLHHFDETSMRSFASYDANNCASPVTYTAGFRNDTQSRRLLDPESCSIPKTAGSRRLLEKSRTELLHMHPQRKIQSAPEGLQRWYDLANLLQADSRKHRWNSSHVASPTINCNRANERASVHTLAR